MMASYWKRRVLGPEEIIHARKARGTSIQVCEIDAFYWDKGVGFFAATVRRNARHWFGDDIQGVTCKLCRERLELDKRDPTSELHLTKLIPEEALKVFTSVPGWSRGVIEVKTPEEALKAFSDKSKHYASMMMIFDYEGDDK